MDRTDRTEIALERLRRAAKAQRELARWNAAVAAKSVSTTAYRMYFVEGLAASERALRYERAMTRLVDRLVAEAVEEGSAA